MKYDTYIEWNTMQPLQRMQQGMARGLGCKQQTHQAWLAKQKGLYWKANERTISQR